MRRRHKVLVGVAVAFAAANAAVALVWERGYRLPAHERCAQRLRWIGSALQRHAAERGRYPESLSELASLFPGGSLETSCREGGPYRFFGFLGPEAPPDIPLVACAASHKLGNDPRRYHPVLETGMEVKYWGERDMRAAAERLVRLAEEGPDEERARRTLLMPAPPWQKSLAFWELQETARRRGELEEQTVEILERLVEAGARSGVAADAGYDFEAAAALARAGRRTGVRRLVKALEEDYRRRRRAHAILAELAPEEAKRFGFRPELPVDTKGELRLRGQEEAISRWKKWAEGFHGG